MGYATTLGRVKAAYATTLANTKTGYAATLALVCHILIPSVTVSGHELGEAHVESHALMVVVHSGVVLKP